MADDAPRERTGGRGRWGAVAALGVGAVVAAGIAAERALVARDRNRTDPYKGEPYGELRGKPVGPVASFDGTLLHVEEAGSGPATLLLSHGFSLNSLLWHHQLKGLAADARLVLFDHRGHGRSARPPSDDFSLEALARDIRAVIDDAARDDRIVLVGHSMGGMAVLQFCSLFPDLLGDRVIGVVLVDTTAADVMGGVVPGARRARAAMQAVQEIAMRAIAGRADTLDRLRKDGTNLSYIGTRLMGFGPKPSPTQVAFLERLLNETPSDVWLSLVPALLGMDLSDVLPLIDVPMLVMVGSHDRLTPPNAAERIVASCRDAELVVLDGAGHTSMLERHEEFNAALRRFLARALAVAERS